MSDFDAWLRALVSTIEAADEPLAEELRALLESPSPEAAAALGLLVQAGSWTSSRRPRSSPFAISCCAWAGRCSWWSAVRRSWSLPMPQARSGDRGFRHRGEHLQRAARAVGRINVSGLPDLQYVGTGWLVEKNTILTNRHVAREFGRRTRGRFTFKKGTKARADRRLHRFLSGGGPRRAARVPDCRDPPYRYLHMVWQSADVLEQLMGGRKRIAPAVLADRLDSILEKENGTQILPARSDKYRRDSLEEDEGDAVPVRVPRGYSRSHERYASSSSLRVRTRG